MALELGRLLSEGTVLQGSAYQVQDLLCLRNLVSVKICGTFLKLCQIRDRLHGGQIHTADGAFGLDKRLEDLKLCLQHDVAFLEAQEFTLRISDMTGSIFNCGLHHTVSSLQIFKLGWKYYL